MATDEKVLRAEKLWDPVTGAELQKMTDEVVAAIDRVLEGRAVVTSLTVVIAALQTYLARAGNAGLPKRVAAMLIRPMAEMLELCKGRGEEVQH